MLQWLEKIVINRLIKYAIFLFKRMVTYIEKTKVDKENQEQRDLAKSLEDEIKKTEDLINGKKN